MAELMKMKVESYRRIANPYDENGYRVYFATVNTKELPGELDNWRKINVRQPNLKSKVAKSIADTLNSSPETFFFKNRGLTLLVENASFDNKEEILSLEFANKELHGLLDGGHTYKVAKAISREKEEDQSEEEGLNNVDAFVKLEIIQGVKDRYEVVDIVDARNSSTQVQLQSLSDLAGKFQVIKDVVDGKDYSHLISYKEYETDDDGQKKPLDIKEILSYLYCFDQAFDSEDHPIVAYSGKSVVVDIYSRKPEKIEKYSSLLPKILELRDEIYLNLPDAYNKVFKGKFGRLTGVKMLNKPRRKKANLYFIGKKSDYSISSGFIYPILASFRCLVEEGEKATWKNDLDPVSLFKDVNEDLVKRIGEQALSLSNPNKMGKDKATWRTCYDLVEKEVLKRQL